MFGRSLQRISSNHYCFVHTQLHTRLTEFLLLLIPNTNSLTNVFGVQGSCSCLLEIFSRPHCCLCIVYTVLFVRSHTCLCLFPSYMLLLIYLERVQCICAVCICVVCIVYILRLCFCSFFLLFSGEIILSRFHLRINMNETGMYSKAYGSILFLMMSKY